MNESELPKEETRKARAPKLSAELALPQSGADTLVKIIKGYAVASNGGETPITYKDVASAAGLNSTLVSRNNRFLADSEILSSPKYGYYVPNEGAIRFAREAAWDEVGAKSHLRRIAAGCWFGQVSIQIFTLRPTLTKEEFKKSLAIKCGASEGDSNALDYLIDFIIYTGLIDVDENGTLTKGNFDEIERPQQTQEIFRVGQGPVDVSPPRPQDHAIHPAQILGASLVIHIHIKNFDDLTRDHAVRLIDWMKILRQSAISAELNIDTENLSDSLA
ncbi:MAG: hypothetical protein IT426_18915 [Pirellulales bacterium]|nr:hypothetical protein [Pirellulales bacterium]